VLLAAAAVAIVLLRDDGKPAPTIMRDQMYTGHGGQSLPLDVFLPADDRTDRPAVLVLHGGSWRGGSRRDLESLAIGAAGQGFVAVNADYSLDAKPAFPAELLDVQGAIRWIRDNAEKLGVDPARVGAMGISAGGHLAALAGTIGTGPLTRGSRLGAVVTWSAPMNLLALTGYAPPPDVVLWNIVLTDVLGCPGTVCPERYVAFSPVTHVTADDPPMLIADALADPAIPYLQAQAMADRLRVAGVPVVQLPIPGSSHAGYADQALVPSIVFLRTQLDLVKRRK
jgi:acetyl esterase/lipase